MGDMLDALTLEESGIAFGDWAANMFTNCNAKLFWGRQLCGLSPEALCDIGCGEDAKTLEALPEIEDIAVDDFAATVKKMPADCPTLTYIARAFPLTIALAQQTVSQVAGVPVDLSKAEAAKLVVVAMHSKAASQWNAMVPYEARVDAETLLVSARSFVAIKKSLDAAVEESMSRLLSTVVSA